MAEAALTVPLQVGAVPLDRLASCVQRLDPPTRALLDLSVRRGVRDDQMAPILRTDPFHLAWRRARALEKIATGLGADGRAAPLGEVRMALEALPREAWGLPEAGPPALPAPPPTTGAALVPALPVPAGRVAPAAPPPSRSRRVGSHGSTPSRPGRRPCAPRCVSWDAPWRRRRSARSSGRAGRAPARRRARRRARCRGSRRPACRALRT